MESKKDKVALNDDLLENVSGGEGEIIANYQCRSCGEAWSSSGEYAVCKYCASPDIVITNQYYNILT